MKNEFKTLRKELELTQEECAEAIGVSRFTIFNWEKTSDIPAYAILSIRYLKALRARVAIMKAAQDLEDTFH